MSTILVADRSVVGPTHIAELYELRGRLVSEISERLGTTLASLITYSEVARDTSLEEALTEGPDHLYGSNLQHALLLARVASRTTGSTRVVLITYSLPSAHHVSGKPFFMVPPVPATLEATRREVENCALDGIEIDVFLVAPAVDGERREELESFFETLLDDKGGIQVSVSPDDDLGPVVDNVLERQ